MKRTSPRRWIRIEAAAITVVLTIGVAAAVIRHDVHPEPSFGAVPPPAHVIPRHPAPHQQTPEIGSGGGSTSTFVPTLYKPRAPAPSSGSGETAPGPRATPTPSHTPSPSDGYPWTKCRSTGGALACTGSAGSFSCTTAHSGATTCTGSGVSFTCSTDAQTGARGCDGGQSQWRCGADPFTGDTHCGGTTGAYNCAAQPGNGVAEECSGSHTFYCYDTPNGRLCRGSQRTDPDCYFEPAFGAYCKG